MSNTPILEYKSLAPKYESLASNFAGESDVVIAKIDAAEYHALARDHGVSGFPTLKFFPSGSSEAVDYSGVREIEDMTIFINEQAGTARAADGSLFPTAGRVIALDSVISAAGTFDQKLVSDLNSVAAQLSGKEAAYAKVR